jgi:hypothetical protein
MKPKLIASRTFANNASAATSIRPLERMFVEISWQKIEKQRNHSEYPHQGENHDRQVQRREAAKQRSFRQYLFECRILHGVRFAAKKAQ